MDAVQNGRYYDFDPDRNAIIIFDGDDSNDWDWPSLASDCLDDEKTATKDAKPSPSASPMSKSADSVPDDIIPDPMSPSRSRKQSGVTASPSRSSSSLKRKKSAVSWISSEAPKGSKRIPYVVQVAHSYTIRKLKMQLTTLVPVDRVELQRQQQEAKAKRAAARAMAAAKAERARAMAAAHGQAKSRPVHVQYPQYAQVTASPPYTAYNGHPVTPQNMAAPAVYRGVHPGMAYRGASGHVHPAAARGAPPTMNQDMYYHPASGATL